MGANIVQDKKISILILSLLYIMISREDSMMQMSLSVLGIINHSKSNEKFYKFYFISNKFINNKFK